MPQVIETSKIADPNGAFPRTLCTVMVQELDQNPSIKPGKPAAAMDHFTLEIVKPAVLQHEGKEVLVAGRTFEVWLSYGDKARFQSLANLRALGFTPPENLTLPFDSEIRSGAVTRIPEIQDWTATLRGYGFEMELWTEATFKHDGPPNYSPVVDPITGQKTYTGDRIVAELRNNIKSQARLLMDVPA